MRNEPMTQEQKSVEEIAREIIEDFDEEICDNCEGSGLVYADKKAHYPFSNAKTVPCSYCHEGKKAISDETRIVMIKEALDSERSKCKEMVDERDRLRKFVSHILHGYSWGHDVDGGDAQDKAEELGLIELRPIKPEDSIDGETEHYFTKWTPK